MPRELRAARARARGDGLDACAGAGGRLRAARLATDCAAPAATQLLVVEFWDGSAALVIAAFFLGRRQPVRLPPNDQSVQQVRERILLVAVGDHLDRSEMMLVELTNAEPGPADKKLVNISTEQKRAEDLLDENRLYRQTALQQGDSALASVLDELERVLLDIAHSPAEMTPAQLEKIRQRMEAHGILFKVRVAGSEVRRRERSATPVPAQDNSTTQKGKHT